MDKIQNVKIVTADPSPLGLFGLAMATLVAAAFKFGFLSGLSLLIPWVIFLGALAQIIACFADIKINNLFGATAFGAYGLFWFAMGFSWMIELGFFGGNVISNIDKQTYGVAFIGYLIFSVTIMFVAAELNKVLFFIIFLINFLFIGLMMQSFAIIPKFGSMLAAVSEILISMLGFYAYAATILNKHFNRVILPVGAPMGWIKKH